MPNMAAMAFDCVRAGELEKGLQRIGGYKSDKRAGYSGHAGPIRRQRGLLETKRKRSDKQKIDA